MARIKGRQNAKKTRSRVVKKPCDALTSQFVSGYTYEDEDMTDVEVEKVPKDIKDIKTIKEDCIVVSDTEKLPFVEHNPLFMDYSQDCTPLKTTEVEPKAEESKKCEPKQEDIKVDKDDDVSEGAEESLKKVINFTSSQTCCVCLNADQTFDDLLIKCSRCCIVFHQECHPSYNEKKMMCEKCEYITENKVKARDIKCKLCPRKEGCMTRFNDKEWVHPTCVNWIPEIWFNDENDKIENLSQLDFENDLKSCSICRRKEKITIQCDYDNCQKWFHVSCAIKNKLIFDHKKMEEEFQKLHEQCPTKYFPQRSLLQNPKLPKSQSGTDLRTKRPSCLL
ncbi:unnamed protein product [Moneuplotes crassus]|uniref:PHD-type domain-containing protein n=1 Tax=Euplotes crassus TaxID=5936 RepID=A0AAD1XDK8_EUPCR|nr:unnamed protein product [Moneuplotes crassus]